MDNNNHFPLPAVLNPPDVKPIQETVNSTSQPFIEANTIPATLEEIRNEHIIPVFARDNEPLISHADFIDSTWQVASEVFDGEAILKPNIRLSHPIKGRIPDARNKPANELESWEKTLYYERMMFVIEIPSIYSTLNGSTLSLTVGGVKAYNLDNLYARKGSDEHFKVFIGFKNSVCTNLCIWSDGLQKEIKVQDLAMLHLVIRNLLEKFEKNVHLFLLEKLMDTEINEVQFAQIIGKTKMYNFLPGNMKKEINPLQLTDTQISSVVKAYYQDTHYSKDEKGSLSLWKLYNLLTDANKSSYIDQFLERGANAYEFVEQLRWSLDNKGTNWYLS